MEARTLALNIVSARLLPLDQRPIGLFILTWKRNNQRGFFFKVLTSLAITNFKNHTFSNINIANQKVRFFSLFLLNANPKIISTNKDLVCVVVCILLLISPTNYKKKKIRHRRVHEFLEFFACLIY